MFLHRTSLFSNHWEGHLGCFYSLTFVNEAVTNTAEQVSAEQNVKPFGHTTESGITASFLFLAFCVFSTLTSRVSQQVVFLFIHLYVYMTTIVEEKEA